MRKNIFDKIYTLIIIEMILILLSCCKKNDDESLTVKDIDGNIYHSIKIDTLVWLVENLKTTKFNNGEQINEILDASEWENLTTSGYCYYDNNYLNIPIYGLLYNWLTVTDPRKIAPIGWHIATMEEWRSLIDYLGGTYVAGGKLKETGFNHWSSPNSGATNEVGFSLLPSGYRASYATYIDIKRHTNLWTSTEFNTTLSWFVGVDFAVSGIGLGQGANKKSGMAVRCVKD